MEVAQDSHDFRWDGTENMEITPAEQAEEV